MKPEDYAMLLTLMTDDGDMMWHEMAQVMEHLKHQVEFEVEEK